MIGDPTRAAMLGALLGGEALPAGELARRAGIAPATATSHLARLVAHGLLVRQRSGRHRYFALASPDVAAALEALGRRCAAPLATRRRATLSGLDRASGSSRGRGWGGDRVGDAGAALGQPCRWLACGSADAQGA